MQQAKVDYLLIGGGLASATAADTLRREGAAGTIRILSAEEFPPYHRPRLSKQYLIGTTTDTDILVHPLDYYHEQEIDLLLGVNVTGVDPDKQIVRTSTGEEIHYEKLLIASGASPKPLKAKNADLAGIFYLRRKSECDAIRDAATTGKRVVVLGGSFLGMEIALSLIDMGLQVTIIDQADDVLPSVEAPQISVYFRRYAEKRGATVLLKDTIEEVIGPNAVTSVKTATGKTIPCELLVVSVGVAPSTEFLEGSGIALKDGYVAVDELLRSNVPNVFAAGDVTDFYDPVFACRRHVEHWDNAVRQGRLAAKNMLDQRQRYDEVSYFYCEIGELGFDMLGMPEGAGERISRGTLDERSYALFYLKNDIPRAAFSMGRPTGETRLAEGLIRYRVNLQKYKDGLGDPAYLLDEISTQTVLILQGGGALGAFECGVVKGLEEEAIYPDIVAGVSIGALNGAIIAGNPRNATAALESFWNDLAVVAPPLPFPEWRRAAVAAQILMFGVPKFFKPRWMPPFDPLAPWTSYYDTTPMKQLIASYVDFAALKMSPVRLLVGAVNVATAELEVFDSYVDDLTPDHILASGSLPPGFSWSIVDGNAYWDGGIVSNSPLDLVLDRCGPDGKRVYIVDLFSGTAPLPGNMVEVLARRDEVVYSERVRSDLRIRELSDAYRGMVNILLSGIAPAERAKIMQHPRFIQLMGDGSATNITRFLRPRIPGEPSSRDYDFSDDAVRHNQAEGYALVKRTLAAAKDVGVSATPKAEGALADLKVSQALTGGASSGQSAPGAGAIAQSIAEAGIPVTPPSRSPRRAAGKERK